MYFKENIFGGKNTIDEVNLDHKLEKKRMILISTLSHRDFGEKMAKRLQCTFLPVHTKAWSLAMFFFCLKKNEEAAAAPWMIAATALPGVRFVISYCVLCMPHSHVLHFIVSLCYVLPCKNSTCLSYSSLISHEDRSRDLEAVYFEFG